MGLLKSVKKIAGGLVAGKVVSLLRGDNSALDALNRQNEMMLQQQQAQLNAMRQQNLLDASNASSQVASVTTGDTLTVAENIKKRKQATTGSMSSSLGL